MSSAPSVPEHVGKQYAQVSSKFCTYLFSTVADNGRHLQH